MGVPGGWWWPQHEAATWTGPGIWLDVAKAARSPPPRNVPRNVARDLRGRALRW